MKTKEMKTLQKLIQAFEVDTLFNLDKEHLGVQSVFIDHKDTERRAVIVVSDNGDIDSVTDIAKNHFKETLHKVIKRAGNPEFTALIKTGKGIKHKDIIGWGTLGGLFNRKNDPFLYGLSNSHVIAGTNNPQEGDNCIYAPNVIVGQLFRWYNLKLPPEINKMDAAIMKMMPNHTTRWVPEKPKSNWIGPRINLRVYKNVAATGITHGIIKSYNGSARVILNGITYFFSGIIAIKSDNGHFNMPGDSGSIVLSSQGSYMVALVFAKYHEYCWALPISRVGALLR